jgi:hypothetical protein
MKRSGLSTLLKCGFLLSTIFCSGVVSSQSQYLTRSVTNGVYTWNINSGAIQLCSSSMCVTPENTAPAVPADAELIILPNGGLWILTGDARYQIFCGIEPTCGPPKTPLAQTTQGARYQYGARVDGRLSAVRAGSTHVSLCSDEPNCVP